MSKVATASLRHHLPGHSSRNKRRSVHSIVGRPSSEMSHIACPEDFASPESGEETATHHRKGSKAGSIVGSIRGLNRRAIKRRTSSLPPKRVSLERPVESVPLPSSPIDIPVVAPSLELDLGPAGFMSSTFEPSYARQQAEDFMKLTDPSNITTGLPKTKNVYLPIHTPVNIQSRKITRQNAPQDLLKLPVEATRSAPPPAPTTPMPGTNFGLEVDGTNSEKSQKSRVFERSVTPPTDKERKELRTMRSLDAMAEACTIAHANDETAQLAELDGTTAATVSPVELDTESTTKSFYDAACSPKPGPSRRGPVHTAGRNLSSAETVHSCPFDMPELTRLDSGQELVQHQTTPVELEGENVSGRTSGDPFNDSNVMYSGPPSPDRKVRLPFRLKASPEIAGPTTDEFARGDQSERVRPQTIEEGRTALQLFSPSEIASLRAKLEQKHSKAVAKQRRHDEKLSAALSPSKQVENLDNVASEEETQREAREPRAIDVALPDHDQEDDSTAEGLPPHGGPLIPQVYRPLEKSSNSSPRSVRSRTTYTAGLGDTEYKFSLDSWLKDSSTAKAPDLERATPNRRRMDMSLDSVSTTEERTTPQISPASTAPAHTPSMGNKLEFDLKRSDRNMRYNALHQEIAMEQLDKPFAPLRATPRFIVGGSEDTEEGGMKFADFERAYAGSREASPKKANQLLQDRVGSQYSVADSLKDAAFDYNQLEARLRKHPSGENVREGSAEESSATLPPLSAQSQSRAFLSPEHARRSGSPSPKKRRSKEELPASSSSYTLNSRNFSPTLPRDNKTSNRFKDLPVMGTTLATPSPPQIESNTQNILLSSSSADSPATLDGRTIKDRVASADSLDQSLQLFSTPGSGYQADKSSMSPEDSSAFKRIPSRYRSKAKRNGTGSPLGEINGNTA